MNNFLNLDLKKEKCFIKHSACISFFSPMSSLYQISKLYTIPKNNSSHLIFRSPFMKNIKYIPNIFAQQVLFSYAQLHAATFCKDQLSPVFAFGSIGIIQGGIQGHSSLYFSKKLNLVSSTNFKNCFKGALFSSSRVIVSQGVPFLYTKPLYDYLRKDKTIESKPYYYFSLFGLSLSMTMISHPLYCLQVLAQNNPTISQYRIAYDNIKKYKFSLFYRGVQSRVLLLLLTNFFNDLFLRDAWCY